MCDRLLLLFDVRFNVCNARPIENKRTRLKSKADSRSLIDTADNLRRSQTLVAAFKSRSSQQLAGMMSP